MKIVLVVSHLGAGGSERVLGIMANYWARTGHEVHLITLSPEMNPAFPIAAEVRRMSAQQTRPPIFGKIGKMAVFRRQLRDLAPEVVVAFGHVTNVITLVASKGLGIPVIVSERNNPGRLAIPWPFALGRFLLYPSAAALVTQTQSIDDWFARRGYRCRRCIIPNPILEKDDREDGESGPVLSGYSLVTVGSLTRQKGHDRLLQIFGIIARQRPEWKLFIVGEGPERPLLEKEIEKQGLQGQVVLLGYQRNPTAIVKQADMFVFTSYYEGFPNALAEAMAAGVPVISFDCPMGPGELIENGQNGILIPDGDCDTFAESLLKLMDDPDRRASLGRQAVVVRQRFSIKSIMGQWEELIHSIRGRSCT